MDRDKHHHIVVAAGIRHGIPFQILDNLIMRESTYNTWAVRYEPGFYRRYVAPTRMALDRVRRQNNWVRRLVTEGTERRDLATSWGLMQVMGQVAREMEFTGPYLTELCDPEIGIRYGCLKLQSLYRRYSSWMAALSAYNAGNPDSQTGRAYAAAVLSNITRGEL